MIAQLKMVKKIDFFDENLLCPKIFLLETLLSKSLLGMFKRCLVPVSRSLAIFMTYVFSRKTSENHDFEILIFYGFLERNNASH